MGPSMRFFQNLLCVASAFVLSACVAFGGSSDDDRQDAEYSQSQTEQQQQEETTVSENVRLPSALITRVKPAPEPKTITLSASDNFATDSAVLSAKGISALDKAIVNLAVANVEKIKVVGHTDSVGSNEYNEDLSMRRAASVKQYLVKRGVPSSVVTIDGMGEEMPVASNDTAQGRAQNRRVEITFQTKQF